MMRRRVQSGTRGFTLVELMSVVAIMGVLATIALAAFNRRAYQSNAVTAKAVMKSITVAEEHYRAENQVYLNVSSTGDPGWYPQKTFPGNTRRTFWRAPPDAGADAETTAWQALAPDIRQQVTFGYKANAGLPTDLPSLTLDPSSGVTLPGAPVEPWYLVQARADANNDGVACYIVMASWSPTIAVVNEGE